VIEGMKILAATKLTKRRVQVASSSGDRYEEGGCHVQD
jgi:hypothetical protein